jgi:hypothetical protein
MRLAMRAHQSVIQPHSSLRPLSPNRMCSRVELDAHQSHSIEHARESRRCRTLSCQCSLEFACTQCIGSCIAQFTHCQCTAVCELCMQWLHCSRYVNARQRDHLNSVSFWILVLFLIITFLSRGNHFCFVNFMLRNLISCLCLESGLSLDTFSSSSKCWLNNWDSDFDKLAFLFRCISSILQELSQHTYQYYWIYTMILTDIANVLRQCLHSRPNESVNICIREYAV